MARKIEKGYPGKVSYKCVCGAGEVNWLCDQIEQVAAKTYVRGISAGFISNEENHLRLAMAAKSKTLRAYLLFVGETAVAYLVGTIRGEIFYGEFTGFDPAFHDFDVGQLLFVFAFGCLSKEGRLCFDFGFGDAFYKKRFGDENWSEVSASICAARVKPVLLNLTDTLLGGGSAWLQHALTYLRALGWLKRVWRRRLAARVASETDPNADAGQRKLKRPIRSVKTIMSWNKER
jgi:hypothetical protein